MLASAAPFLFSIEKSYSAPVERYYCSCSGAPLPTSCAHFVLCPHCHTVCPPTSLELARSEYMCGLRRNTPLMVNEEALAQEVRQRVAVALGESGVLPWFHEIVDGRISIITT